MHKLTDADSETKYIIYDIIANLSIISFKKNNTTLMLKVKMSIFICGITTIT